MLTLNCTSCGAQVTFQSSLSVFSVCTYCHSMLVRHDMNLEGLGKMSALPEDTSVLQIGTQGSFDKSGFVIIGRLRMSWENGHWNEWYIALDDGRTGWLAEAQGIYMVSFPHDNVSGVPPLHEIAVGQDIYLFADHPFHVDDIKKVVCSGSMGELPFKAVRGRKSTSIDLSSEGHLFACLDFSDEGTKLYVGNYVDFDSLKLVNLREVDGW